MIDSWGHGFDARVVISLPLGKDGGDATTVHAMTPLALLVRRALRDPRFRRLLLTLGPAAAKTATDLARQGRWRQLAVVHADTVVDGTFLRVPIDGEPHWVVWSGDDPVAAYPPPATDLSEALRSVDLARRRRPDDLRLRSARREAADRARRIRRALPGRGPGRAPW